MPIMFNHESHPMNVKTKDPRFRTWPITEVEQLEPYLKELGMEISSQEVRQLCDALVSVGPAGRGGTGSFISAEGLIITNHHVALDAVRRASTVETDHLKNGFCARTKVPCKY
jgi:S1-C subfamily serine protease